MDFLPLAVWLSSYLVGAIPFGYLVAKARGVDIYAHGSGNIGATNVGRVLGRKFGILVFVLDFLKGAIPTGVARILAARLAENAWAAGGWLEVGAAVAAFLGHCFPIYLGFRGGKGVATGAGTVAVLFPESTAAAILGWFLVAQATRLVSLASILAIVILFTMHVGFAGFHLGDPRTIYVTLGGTFVVFRHRTNVKRLWLGTENRFQENGIMELLARSLHVMAVGLWFGMAAFFSFAVALGIFDRFETLGRSDDRPTWFPKPGIYAATDGEFDGPKEQGSRAAGFVIGPLFSKYYLWQTICGVLAIGTAVAWAKRGEVHAWRMYLAIAALLLAVLGWAVERKVAGLQPARNAATEAYLQADASSAASLHTTMVEKRKEFTTWHLVDVFLNLGVIALTAVLAALAGHLPPRGTTPTALVSAARTEGTSGLQP